MRSALCILLATLGGAAMASPQEPAGEGISPDRAAALEHLVRQDCGACHGMTLKGGLGPDIRAETLRGTPPETLGAIILDGVPGTAMPPWRPLLSEAEVRWIANYLLEAEPK